MEPKYCAACETTKPADQFNKNKARPDGLASTCRDCMKTYRKAHYIANTEKVKKAVQDRRTAIKADSVSKLIRYLAEHPCVDCDNHDVRVLEFDHVRGDKRREISKMVSEGYSWSTILTEIAKCEVRCSNCHRIVTAERGGFYRSDWGYEAKVWLTWDKPLEVVHGDVV